MKNREEMEAPHLTILSWGGAWGRALSEAVSEPFARQTGIRVKPRFHVGLRLPEALSASGANRDRPPVDLVWSNAVPAMKAAQAGACVPLSEEELPHLAALPPRAKPLTFPSGWPLVCPYAVHYVLAYRCQAFPREKPHSWEVLLNPRFRGKVALYPEGNGLHPIAQVMGGGRLADIPTEMEPCWNFFAALRPQVSRLEYSVGMEERLRREELDLVFRALPNALEFRRSGLNVDWSAPREGVADTLDALWIPRNLPEEKIRWAKSYIDFALSPEVLERWCGLLGVLPMNPRAAPSALFRENSGLPRSPEDFRGVLHIPEEVKLENAEAWKNKFEGIFNPF